MRKATRERQARPPRGPHPTLEKLIAYGDDELDDAEEEKVREHIAECETCCEQFMNLLRSPVADLE
jgi:anti-sigma factor RsiW